MKDQLPAIIIFVIGIIPTVLVGRYYYQRSLKKSLTPYLKYISSPFTGMDAAIKQRLTIKYQEQPVKNLFEIEFLVANTGDKAISDVIEPLSFAMPTNTTLLDANILHVNPRERKVEIEVSQDRTRVVLHFKLLNKEEFFIFKMLLDGDVKTKDFSFSITAEDLPPTLTPEWIGDALSADEKHKLLEVPEFLVGLIILLFTLCVGKLIYDSWATLANIFDYGFLGFFSHITFGAIAVALSIPPVALMFLLGMGLTIASFTGGQFPPTKRKFKVPKSLMTKGPFMMNVDDKTD